MTPGSWDRALHCAPCSARSLLLPLPCCSPPSILSLSVTVNYINQNLKKRLRALMLLNLQGIDGKVHKGAGQYALGLFQLQIGTCKGMIHGFGSYLSNRFGHHGPKIHDPPVTLCTHYPALTVADANYCKNFRAFHKNTSNKYGNDIKGCIPKPVPQIINHTQYQVYSHFQGSNSEVPAKHLRSRQH